MFEKAVRMKLRWPHNGQVNAEDLWDLPLAKLDGIYKALAREARARTEESLLDAHTEEDEVLALKIAVVKHVVSVRVAEREAAMARAENAARKQKLLAVLERKQTAALDDLPVDELQAMIDAL